MKIISPLKSQDNMIVIKFGYKIITNHDMLEIIRKETAGYLETKLRINWLSATDSKTAFAKQMYRYMLFHFSLYNQAHISYYTGGQDHSIVMKSIETIRNLTFSDSQVNFKVNELTKIIETKIKDQIK